MNQGTARESLQGDMCVPFSCDRLSIFALRCQLRPEILNQQMSWLEEEIANDHEQIVALAKSRLGPFMLGKENWPGGSGKSFYFDSPFRCIYESEVISACKISAVRDSVAAFVDDGLTVIQEVLLSLSPGQKSLGNIGGHTFDPRQRVDCLNDGIFVTN